MTKDPDRKTAKQQRAERLAEALRENLKRRKSQARKHKMELDGNLPTPSADEEERQS